MVLDLGIYTEINKLRFLLYTYKYLTNNGYWVNERAISIKFLEEKKMGNLYFLGIKKRFLGYNSKNKGEKTNQTSSKLNEKFAFWESL